MLWAMDWLVWAVGGAVVIVALVLFLRSSRGFRSPRNDVGPDSTPEAFQDEIERDLEVERLGTRPKI